MKVTTIYNPKKWQQVIDRKEEKDGDKTCIVYTLEDGSTIMRSQVLEFLFDDELGNVDQVMKNDS
jgi:hypothetical protein